MEYFENGIDLYDYLYKPKYNEDFKHRIYIVF